MKEIQGKSTLVRVSVRFELARVGVSGSQPYVTLSQMDSATSSSTVKYFWCSISVAPVVWISLFSFISFLSEATFGIAMFFISATIFSKASSPTQEMVWLCEATSVLFVFPGGKRTSSFSLTLILGINEWISAGTKAVGGGVGSQPNQLGQLRQRLSSRQCLL